jgi:hypothetical protein
LRGREFTTENTEKNKKQSEEKLARLQAQGRGTRRCTRHNGPAGKKRVSRNA